MKKAFTIIICVMAAVVFAYGVHRAVAPVSSQELTRASHEHSTSARGYIVRDETAYYADRDGRLYTNVTVGSRVARDSLIYTIYDISVDSSVISELNTLDRRIAEIKATEAAAGYNNSSISVESEIASRTAQIIGAARENDVISIAQYKKDIKSLRQNGSVVSTEEELWGLEDRKMSLESQLGGSRSGRYAENSGVFTTYYDGLEDVLSADRIEEYTVEYIESLGNAKPQESRYDTVEAGDFVCSVVNNHTWGVLLVVDESRLNGYSAGDTVTVRFNNIAGEERKGKIIYISSEEQNKDGRCFVLIECSDYFEGAYSYRSVDADIVFERYSGYSVPAQAVRSDGQKQIVIGIADNQQYPCEIEVLYSNADEGYVIVDSVEGADHVLSSMNRILVGER